jgi:hypothetical protein
VPDAPHRSAAARIVPPAIAWGVAAVACAFAVTTSDHARSASDAASAAIASADAAERDAAARVEAAGPDPSQRRRVLALEARLAARADTARHLRLDLEAGTAALYDGPYPLRTFPIAVSTPASALYGSRRIVATWGAHATAPDRAGFGLLAPPGAIEDAPWPDRRPADAWDAALVSDDALGILLYSATPTPPAVMGEAAPGTLRAAELDLAAILPSLAPGTNVHVW